MCHAPPDHCNAWSFTPTVGNERMGLRQCGPVDGRGRRCRRCRRGPGRAPRLPRTRRAGPRDHHCGRGQRGDTEASARPARYGRLHGRCRRSRSPSTPSVERVVDLSARARALLRRTGRRARQRLRPARHRRRRPDGDRLGLRERPAGRAGAPVTPRRPLPARATDRPATGPTTCSPP